MKLAYLPLTLFALVGFLCVGNAAHIRSAGRLNRAHAVRRRCDLGGGDTMGQDCPTQKLTSTKHTSTLPNPTHPAPANYTTGPHNAAPKWYPEDGAGIEIYKMATPGKSQPYISNGTCVNLQDDESRKTTYTVDAFRLAPGIACQFYSLPDCQQPLDNGKIKNEGFWNASMIWQPPIFSSFQCCPKACEQPVPPIDYAVVATATFTCAHEPTMIPVGFTKANYRIVLSSAPTTATVQSSATAATSSPYVATTTLYGGGSPQPYYQQGCEENGGTNC